MATMAGVSVTPVSVRGVAGPCRRRPSRRASPDRRSGPRAGAVGVGSAAEIDADDIEGWEAALVDPGVPLAWLEAASGAMRDRSVRAHLVTYSRKVFIPLTRLCRDTCGYCTFAGPPSPGAAAFLSVAECVEVARRGAEAGCTEALFTLGDTPEARWPSARAELDALGYESTLGYLGACCRAVVEATGLIPHVNAGVMSESAFAELRRVSGSQGLMLESVSDRLGEPGGPHFGAPDKVPSVRLAALEAAGRASVPFTTGILVGIGETRQERLDALRAIRASHARWGHVQECIVQPFRAKPGTAMRDAPEPDVDEVVWSVCAARLILGPDVSVQTPPNLSDPAHLARFVRCGVSDWGGVSPGVTPDHVNPERAWPDVRVLERATADAGKLLVPRLPVYPEFLADARRWIDGGSLRGRGAAFAMASHVRRLRDTDGLARPANAWCPGDADGPLPSLDDVPLHLLAHDALGRGSAGASEQEMGNELDSIAGAVPAKLAMGARAWAACAPGGTARVRDILGRCRAARERWTSGGVWGLELTESEVVALLGARGADYDAVCLEADLLRRTVVPSLHADGARSPTYVVVRNINYTNVCTLACTFCAFSKGRTRDEEQELRGPAYTMDEAEVGRRVAEAVGRGAVEVCMQGGIHPSYTGETYLGLLRAAKQAAPEGIHVHAFSPLEVAHGAEASGTSVPDFLRRLKDAGLGSLPGTAAEVLDDAVRADLCPDKLSASEWLAVVRHAHDAGLDTTSTLMFGHLDAEEGYVPWARHLAALKDLNRGWTPASGRGRVTEFVPLPFVPMEAPAFRRGDARRGPTFREAILVHAVGRLALFPEIAHVQASWTKLGPAGARVALCAGADDMGGTLMNESISRAAGAGHGQEMSPGRMEALARSLPPDPLSGDPRGGTAGSTPRAVQRTTLYQTPDPERVARSMAARGDLIA